MISSLLLQVSLYQIISLHYYYRIQGHWVLSHLEVQMSTLIAVYISNILIYDYRTAYLVLQDYILSYKVQYYGSYVSRLYTVYRRMTYQIIQTITDGLDRILGLTLQDMKTLQISTGYRHRAISFIMMILFNCIHGWQIIWYVLILTGLHRNTLGRCQRLDQIIRVNSVLCCYHSEIGRAHV